MSRAEPETLAQLFLQVERHHDRAAVLQSGAADGSERTPDWRFHRAILRIALYLRERGGLQSGERVASLAPLGPLPLMAEWAAVLQGAEMAAVAPELSDAALRTGLTRLAPRIVFVADAAQRERLQRLSSEAPHRLPQFLVYDDGGADAGTTAWGTALELGGTLDTAERAQNLRELARSVTPEAPALASVACDGAGGAVWHFLTHRQVIDRLRAFWTRVAPKPGDVAYVAPGPSSVSARLALYAFTGDGLTSTVFGTAGAERMELERLRPRRIVGPAAIVEPATSAAPTRGGANGTRPPAEGPPRILSVLRRLNPMAMLGRSADASAPEIVRFEVSPAGGIVSEEAT